jgi:predicted MFS family arabinose efflux permease
VGPVQGVRQETTPAQSADRAARNAAITLALTLPGDTVLYLLLPLYAATFGVTLPEAGLLLAANRLVRIAGNGWIARLFADHGARICCLLAAFGSIAAALTYATASGVWALLVARLVWGLSFSAMNIANQALSTSLAEGAARRMGQARTIVAVGPTAGLLAGAAIAHQWGPRVVFVLLAAVACLAPLFALRLPATREVIHRNGARIGWPDAMSVWSFSTGLTLDGLFIFGLGLLAAASYPRDAVLAAGCAMALRYAVEIAFSSAGGRLGQRYGARPMLILLTLGAAVSLAVLAAGGVLLWLGVVATIVLRALLATLSAPVVAEAYPGSARVPALATNATWRDIGAGVGPLVAGVVFPLAPAWVIYGSGAALIVAAALLLMRRGLDGRRC